MDSQTLERIFGGISFLVGAGSRDEFFSNLEAFLGEIYGPLRFSVIQRQPSGGRFRVEFSTHAALRIRDGEAAEAECPELAALPPADFVRSAGDRVAPFSLLIGGKARAVVHGGKLLSTTDGVRTWLLFHDPAHAVADGDRVFGTDEVAIDYISFAYQRIRDQERLHREHGLLEAKLSAINGLGELIGSTDLEVLLTRLMELSLFIAGAQVGSVVLCGESGIESRVEWGLPLEIARKIAWKGGASVLDQVLMSAQAELIQNYQDPDRFQPIEDSRVDSFLCIPLVTKGRILGAINLVNSSDGSGFRQDDRECILTIAGLAATAIENAILYRDSLEKERMAEQLRIAQVIQTRLYPKECPRIPGYAMAWTNLSCDETGGDYFDFIPIDDNHVGVVIGDAAGHGIGAALLMATGRANLRALFSVKQGLLEVVTALDGLLSNDMDEERFMTLFIGKLDHRQNILHYLNAGHDCPLFYRAAAGQVDVLDTTGLPLGIMGGASTHSTVAPIPFGARDALLLVSDGVWEGTDINGQRFGRKRLAEVFARVADESAPRIVERLQEEVFAFTRGVARKDDFTILVVKRVE